MNRETDQNPKEMMMSEVEAIKRIEALPNLQSIYCGDQHDGAYVCDSETLKALVRRYRKQPEEMLECLGGCGYQEPYGFVPEADCPVHDLPQTKLRKGSDITNEERELEQNPKDEVGERAEHFAYHSDVPHLTVQHVDLLTEFTASETADLQRRVAELETRLGLVERIAKEMRADVIECSNLMRAKVLDLLEDRELAREADRCLADVFGDVSRLQVACEPNIQEATNK